MHTTINTKHRAGLLQWLHAAFALETRIPATVAFDDPSPAECGNDPALTQPDASDAGDAHPALTFIELKGAIAVRKFELLPPRRSLKARISRFLTALDSAKERLHRKVQTVQDGILDFAIDRCKTTIDAMDGFTQRGDFGILFLRPNRHAASTIGVSPFFQQCVVELPRNVEHEAQCTFLLARWIETNAFDALHAVSLSNADARRMAFRSLNISARSWRNGFENWPCHHTASLTGGYATSYRFKGIFPASANALELMKRLRAGVCVAALLLCRAPASADETSIGITVNATTGSHIESSRVSSIPLLPLPTLEIDHVHRQFHLHLEGVPSLGPVPLAQSNPYSESLAPRVSYLNGELLYRSNLEPLEIGIGETVLNQQTLDQFPYFQNSSRIQYSRVVGMRIAARGQLFADARRRLDLSLAVNPAMHGLQDGTYAEDASLFDGSLRWTMTRSRYNVVYGLRYLNYTAAYSSTHALGDRNHLFMPFVGIDWHAKQSPERMTNDDPPAPVPLRAKTATTSLGVSLFGSNGNRSYTGAYSQVPLNFVLLPEFQATHSFGRYELQAEGILPNDSANPFGSSLNRWSYLSAGALANTRSRTLAFGLGETVTNLVPLGLSPSSHSATRSEALDLLARVRFEPSLSGEFYAFFRIDPYVHVSTLSSFEAGSHVINTKFTAHGARVDATLGRNIDLRRYALDYGLRYINQTTNYDRGVLTRDTSLMPFIGINVPF